MFGVDQYGNDILTPQFSRGANKAGRAIKPGQSADLEISMQSMYEFLSKSPEARGNCLRQVLFSMYKKEQLTLDEVLLEEVRQGIIEERRSLAASHQKQSENMRLHLISAPNVPMDSAENLFRQSRIDAEVAAHEAKKTGNLLKRKIDHKHPEVIRKALFLAYERGDFAAIQSTITREVETLLRKKALEKAKESIAAQMIETSRAAVLALG